MPRAKKAVPRTRPTNKSIVLDSETAEYLCSEVGIKTNGPEANKMIRFIESHLMGYYALHAMFDKPSLGSQIKSIEHIEREAHKLFKDLRDLELNTRILLYSDKFSDVTTEWIGDREALIKIYQRCFIALEPLKPQKKAGRKIDNALRITTQALSEIFYQYNIKSKDAEKNCRHFIHYALEAAHIKHPDPDDQPSKFNALFNDKK